MCSGAFSVVPRGARISVRLFACVAELPIPSTQLDPPSLTLKLTKASAPQQRRSNEPDWGRGG